MNIKKAIYKILGLIFLGIGIAGYYLPVLPGTIFLIIAAYFFMQSSDILYNKIINHPVYGNPIKEYLEKNIIPFKTKVIILLSMWATTFITVYITPSMRYSLILESIDKNFIINFKVLGVILAIIGTIFVLKTKNK